MLDHPFMDDVHRFTYQGMKDVPRSMNEAVTPTLRDYRTILRRANRFIIDDDMVKLACHLTRDLKKVELWSSLSRLPYDAVWIEFDLHEKVREFEKMGTLRHPFDPDQTSRVVGYLLRKDLPSTTRWLAHEFVAMKDTREVYEQPCVMVFDPEGSSITPVRGSTLLGFQTLGSTFLQAGLPAHIKTNDGMMGGIELRMQPEASMMGLMGWGKITVEKDGMLPVPEWVAHKVGLVPSPFWVAWHGLNRASVRDWEQNWETPNFKSLVQTVSLDANERSGVLKYLICLLGAINETPTTTKRIMGRKGSMSVGMHNLKFMEHHRIGLSLPKHMQIVKYAEKLMTASAHRKRHEVRGHWRVIEKGIRLPYPCNHEATMVENGVGICTRCTRMIRWIEHHERGDASLGWVTHEYAVKARH
jgi:hypothetical protein